MQQLLPWLVILVGIGTLAYIGLVARTTPVEGAMREVKPSARSADGLPASKATSFRTAQFVQIGITLLILASALFIILSKGYEEAEQKWAFGAIGTILGYWLKK